MIDRPVLVVFDSEGTLLRLKIPREEVVAGILMEEGLPVDVSAIRGAYRIMERVKRQSSVKIVTPEHKKEFLMDFNRMLFETLGMETHSSRLAPKLYHAFSKTREWILFDDAEHCIRTLFPSYKLGILANWDSGLKDLYERLGYANYFQFIISSQELKLEKPDVSFFVTALEDWKEYTIIYVGNDYMLDVAPSRKAGFLPVLIDRYNAYPMADCNRIRHLDLLHTLCSKASEP